MLWVWRDELFVLMCLSTLRLFNLYGALPVSENGKDGG